MMKDQHKYRAWDTQENKMIYVGLDYELECLNLPVPEVAVIHMGMYGGSRFILMQCAGLIDIDKTLIFEKDVIYLAGYGDYLVEFPFTELYMASYEKDIGEIKGNIYQKPELSGDLLT